MPGRALNPAAAPFHSTNPRHQAHAGTSPSASSNAPAVTANTPTALSFEQVNRQYNFCSHRVDCMIASMLADSYAKELIAWCHGCLNLAVKRHGNDFEADRAAIDRSLEMLVFPTATPDRSSIQAALRDLKTHMAVLRDHAGMTLDPSRLVIRVSPSAFCLHLWRNPDSVPVDELELWNDVVLLHTGVNIGDTARRFPPLPVSRL